jgi:hypothetical protein
MTLQFLVSCDRGALARDEVEKSLEPAKQELARLGITTLNIIKVAAAIVCTAPKDVFEKTFSTKVEGTDVTNWKIVGQKSIPDSLKQTGIVDMVLDQQRTIS